MEAGKYTVSLECAYMRSIDGGLYIKDFQNEALYKLERLGYGEEDHRAIEVDEVTEPTLYQVTPKIKMQSVPVLTCASGIYRTIQPVVWDGDFIMVLAGAEEATDSVEGNAVDAWADEHYFDGRTWFCPVPKEEVEDLLMSVSVDCKMVDREMQREDN